MVISMNEKIERETLLLKADEYYRLNDFVKAINYYITVVNQLADDEKINFHHIYYKLGSSYLQQASILIDKDKQKSILNAVYASKAFEFAALYQPENPVYPYYLALAKNMLVSEGLDNPDDLKQLHAAIYLYKKAKNLGCTIADLDQRLECAQQQSAIILARINKKYESDMGTSDNTPRQSKRRVNFSPDTLFNDHKNSDKNLKQASDIEEPESDKNSSI